MSRGGVPGVRWLLISSRATAGISGRVKTSSSTVGGDRALMPVLPSLGERGVPPGCQPLAGDVLRCPGGEPTWLVSARPPACWPDPCSG